MDQLLRKSGISLNRSQIEKLWRYHGLLRKYNDTRELTRIIGFENIVVKHYVDCMIVSQYVDLPSPIVDIGTGPGFPGIPLKILHPDLEIVLAEPRPKRVEFLNRVISELKLTKASVFDHRVVSRSFQKPMKAAITRAVETIDKTILRTSACLSEGGRLIFLKGPNVDPEIKDVLKRFRKDIRLLDDVAYNLPGTEHERRLVVFEKISPARIPDASPDTDEAAENEDSLTEM